MYSLNKSKFLLESELQALNETLRKFRESAPRDVLILELSLHTGARASELLNLRIQDLDFHENTVFIRGLKGSRDREIPIPSELFKRLYEYANLPAQSRYRFAHVPGADLERIFPISYTYFRDIWVLYRPVSKKLHCLRHTFALNLYRRTRDLKLVQQALGHAALKNTEVYLNYEYSTNELRKLIIQEPVEVKKIG